MVQVMATLAAAVVVVSGITAGVVFIRKWIQGLAATALRTEQAATVAADHTTEQLRTSNGHTVGEYVEQTASTVEGMRSEISVLTGWASDNRTLAQQARSEAAAALGLAQRANDRLDELLAKLAAGGGL